jgi:ABC-type polysaccharide/polyol phosphate export permease
MHISNWELWCRQSLELTTASMKSRYRKTLAGVLWVLLNPIILFGVQALVFRKFLRLEITNFYLFLVGGLIPWVFISQTTQMATPVIIGHSHLLRSFRLHPIVLITSSVLDNFFNFCLTLLVVVVPTMLAAEMPLKWELLFAPLALLPLLIMTFSLSALLSLMNVYFRDTNFVLGFLFSILFFLTPIFYPLEYVPDEYRWMVNVNPVHYAIAPFRSLIYETTPYAWVTPCLEGLAVALGCSLVAWLYWRRKKDGIYLAL